MDISYYGLWKIMQERGLTQKMMEENCKITPNTFTKMRRGQPIAIDTLMRICDYLDCDFSDIMTRFVPVQQFDPATMLMDQRCDAVKLGIQRALSEYMEKNALTVANVHEITGLSINTIKAIINEHRITSTSIMKLTALGRDYLQLSNKYALDEYNKIENVPTLQEEPPTPQKRHIEIGALEWEKMSYMEKARIHEKADVVHIIPPPATPVMYSEYMSLLALVPEGKITRQVDIEEYLRKKYKADRITFIEDEYSSSPKWKHVPWWREVSTKGMIQDVAFVCPSSVQIAKLQAEGHNIVPCGAYGRSLKVENYKDVLFDFGSIKPTK